MKIGECDLKNLSKLLALSIPLAVSNGLIEQDIEERFNFKPVYASSFAAGVDMASVQSFEQAFFNDYAALKRAQKLYKHRAALGFKLVRDIEHQLVSFTLLGQSLGQTFDEVCLQRG